MAGPEATAAATHAPRRLADPVPSAEPAPSCGSAALCSARPRPFESPGGASHRPQTSPGATSSVRHCSGWPSPPLALLPPQLEPQRPLPNNKCVVRVIHFKRRVSRSQSRCWFRRTGLCGWSRGPRTGCRPSPSLPSPTIPSSPPPESAGSSPPCPQDQQDYNHGGIKLWRLWSAKILGLTRLPLPQSLPRLAPTASHLKAWAAAVVAPSAVARAPPPPPEQPSRAAQCRQL